MMSVSPPVEVLPEEAPTHFHADTCPGRGPEILQASEIGLDRFFKITVDVYTLTLYFRGDYFRFSFFVVHILALAAPFS